MAGLVADSLERCRAAALGALLVLGAAQPSHAALVCDSEMCTMAIESHDSLVADGIQHDGTDIDGHPAHWSWVATPPDDLPGVTTVNYFVDAAAHGGNALSAAQIADIHAAASVWNNSGANVSLSSVATDALADIHVHMDSASGCGGSAIGCAEISWFTAHNGNYPPGSGHPAVPGATHPQHLLASQVLGGTQELTMLDLLATWYSGAAGSIGAFQLDFQTVAIQEFGHHLGLEHNGNASHGHPAAEEGLSPMNGLASFGTTRRVLQPSDTTATIHLYGQAVLAPEPSMLALLSCAALALAVSRRR